MESDSSQLNYFSKDIESSKFDLVINDYDLDPLLSIIHIMMFDRCKDELNLVCSAHRREIPSGYNEEFTYIPPELRFGFSDEFIEQENLKIKLTYENSSYIRIVQITNLAINIINLCMQDLSENDKYLKFFNAISDLEQMKKDEKDILRTNKRINRLNYKLIEEIILEKQELMDCIKKTNKIIVDMEGNFQNEIEFQSIKYMTNVIWEESRQEQNLYSLKIKEKTFIDFIVNKNNETDDEKLAHDQLIQFFKEDMNDIQEQIEIWMNKYDDDLEDKEMEIFRTRIEMDRFELELLDSINIYNNRVKDIKNWKEYKIRRKLKAKLEIKKLWAVIVVQMWWRNVLKKIRLARKKLKKNKKDKKKSLTKKKK